ncbi:MAG: hypothetical protein JJ970_08190 [Erythrobacter sp.]|nr:hypothetical protein [Erythrobacter sp.]MBO6530001.1 hypothetical protein [Erythrobacter sp.]
MIDRLGGFFGSRDAEEDFDDEHVEESDADIEPPPSPVGQDERRMQVRAYNHWASQLGDLNFPHIDDLEPGALEDFGPYSLLLDLSDDIEDPRVGFVGTELAAECGHDDSLERLSRVPGRSVLSRITDHYMQILANQAPIGFEAEFVNEHGATVLYRGILLPYSSDNATIDFIYGVINWKQMADQQTADALLLELDHALDIPSGDEAEGEAAIETAETLTNGARDQYGEDVLELGNENMMDNHAPGILPEPAFGTTDEDEDENAFAEPAARAALSPRVDALGNPVGGPHAGGDSGARDEDDFDGGLKTAADYGLPEWDEDEETDEDVDDVVDPLADDSATSGLVALVNRGDRTKKSVDLSTAQGVPAMPQAHEAGDDPLPARMPQAYEVPAEASVEPDAQSAADDTEFAIVTEDEAPAAVENGAPEAEPPAEAFAADAVDSVGIDASPEGLHDCLAAARQMAQAAQSTEDRSRKALYAAVGRAYDFSLEAQDAPEDFDELVAEHGLTVQDRAPMTPVVKLVFGTDYDKTRITEYAAVLMHAHRVGVERGRLAAFLREAEGGLKGVVQAERKARKEEQGKPVDTKKAVRPALAEKLRALETLSLAELEEDGAEFALVMVRRTSEGELEVIGEVPENIPLVERAARKLLG